MTTHTVPLGVATGATRTEAKATTATLAAEKTIVTGPFQGFFPSIATPLADWLFMAGMLGIGLAVILGIGLRVSAVAGTAR